MNVLLDIVHRSSANLRSRLLIHGASVLLVASVFAVVILSIETGSEEKHDLDRETQKYLDVHRLDFGDPIDRAMFRESLDIFHPGQSGRNDSLLRAIDNLRERQFIDPSFKSGGTAFGITWPVLGNIGLLFLQFIGIYVIVLAIIYVGAQRIALYRFIKMKQHRESYFEYAYGNFVQLRAAGKTLFGIAGLRGIGLPLLKGIVKGIGFVILFSPAYVIAYSLKTSVDTSTLLFMILLGIVSNGVLIHTANRFFTLLVSESHKGYVQTAIVKGLHASYDWDVAEGIPKRMLLRQRDGFRLHVLGQIFSNARFQFIPALKEHASFLITGLIIIEMALNIQGHLCYELLQRILYRQYDVACIIIFAIFLTVKMTEAVVDIWHDREKRRYGY